MGAACQCRSFCPGDHGINNFQQISQGGFSDQVQIIIDSIRQIHKNQMNGLKNHNLQQGRIFRGKLLNGKKSGYGELYNGNNAFFGIFVDDLPEGQGLLVKDRQNYIKGLFKQGKPNGEVRQKINTTSFYGFYFQGQKSRGVLKTQNYSYEGSFQENKFEGYGILLFKNGDRYQGDFKNGQYDGFGKYQTVQQGFYKGDFKNGLYDGNGIFCWRDGYQYSGQYKNGLRNGKGTFRKGKQVYEGLWLDGQPVNKDKISGSPHSDKIHLKKVKREFY